MNKPLILSIGLGLISTSFAALPPQYQNIKDLEVMVVFIERHERVAANLKSIDVQTYTVHYDKDCVARFARKYVPKPDGWVGPADPLEFRESNCPVK